MSFSCYQDSLEYTCIANGEFNASNTLSFTMPNNTVPNTQGTLFIEGYTEQGSCDASVYLNGSQVGTFSLGTSTTSYVKTVSVQPGSNSLSINPSCPAYLYIMIDAPLATYTNGCPGSTVNVPQTVCQSLGGTCGSSSSTSGYCCCQISTTTTTTTTPTNTTSPTIPTNATTPTIPTNVTVPTIPTNVTSPTNSTSTSTTTTSRERLWTLWAILGLLTGAGVIMGIGEYLRRKRNRDEIVL